MMSEVLLVLTVLAVNCESYKKPQKPFPGRNQRIIKVQGPPHFNHFHGHHKPIRKRPYGPHHGDEFIRPNHPPPIPPFFNGPSTNHIKHLPRPPPHVYHKSPSYGLGFPYKTSSSFRQPIVKDHFRTQKLPSVRPAAVAAASGTQATSSSTFHSPSFASSTFISNPVSHIITSDENGPIREIPAPNLAPKPHDEVFGSVAHLQSDGVAHLQSDGVGHIQSDGFLNSFEKEVNIDVNTIVKDSGLDIHPFVKDASSELSFGNKPTVEIANFDEGSAIDVTNLIKEAAVAPELNSGYEVTEHYNHHPSNDQVIKGHDGTKLYYAPDPDPSLPVHKVPPTYDPHSTPSNGQMINSVFLQQIPQGFSYLQGGSVGSLSSQDLFQLMHGYPNVISQPVVAFVGQPQSPGVILPGAGHNYYQQSSEGSIGHYSQQGQYNEDDISHYLRQPEIHNLLHNSPESHHEQESLGASHSSVTTHDNYPQQSVYSPQNQYQSYVQNQYPTSHKSGDSNSESTQNYATSEIQHNYQYEPEASESNTRNSLTVIRQTNEGSLSSETVKELLLEDSAMNTKYEQETTPKTITTIIQLKNTPEVPFYASLPSKKAAEALASLQAAGSVANSYMNRIKISRGDQGPDKEIQERTRKLDDETNGSILKGETVELGREKTVVEVQHSLPLYEKTISSKNLLDDEEIEEDDRIDDNEEQEEEDLASLDFKEDVSSETFGKRIRPK